MASIHGLWHVPVVVLCLVRRRKVFRMTERKEDVLLDEERSGSLSGQFS